MNRSIVIRVFIALGILGAVSAGGFLTFAAVAPTPVFDVRAPDVRASSDPAIVERGAYLVHAVAHCGECHASKSTTDARPPLTGGDVISTPFGEYWGPNITPHDHTGVGTWTDAELARVVRHAVGRDGRVSPFMKVAIGPMSDEDITAVVSYLRASTPVEHAAPVSAPNLIGRILALTAFGPAYGDPPPYAPPADTPSLARGRYLAEGPAGCYGCHTNTDLFDDLAAVNAPFSGGRPHKINGDPPMEVVPPNLTPDPETGVLARFTEDAFVARFRQDATIPGTIMPWRNYAKMTDSDLRSIYRFLASLEPVRNAP